MIATQTDPPNVTVEPAIAATTTAPVRQIDTEQLKTLGQNLAKTFEQYRSDRRIAELKWLRNLRQYLGIYDPEIEKELLPNRSKAYPRITRIKSVSVLSRLMNLMFPSNERNWSLEASPSPDMSPQDVMQAVEDAMQKSQQAGVQVQVTDELVQQAVQTLADNRAKQLSLLIDDQLQEIGGDQTIDYVALNRKAVASGILYGLGLLRGPFVRQAKSTTWAMDPQTGQPAPKEVISYKPMFEFLSIWDFYPDLSAKTLAQMDGYFVRMVMSRAQVRKLANRQDFFADPIKSYLSRNLTGNYKAQTHETELRIMGIKEAVNEQKTDSGKYEILIWNGPISGSMLQSAGVQVDPDKLADDIESEVWIIDNVVIKADMNPWRKIGVDLKTIHPFQFDEDDTSPIGNGLPNVVRDSQMSISAAARMLLDNASVVCGPNVEVNTDLLDPKQDLTAVTAYKIWYRNNGSGQDAQFPAVRNVQIDSHLNELMQVIDLFMKFADAETFVGPATGGDMDRPHSPSEPMRTAAGASMLRADAALPFKDIVRNFDLFTQSVIYSLVVFNRKFNPARAPEGDYNVIARGASSLIAKEIRGTQIDQIAATLTPEEKDHVDERKLVEARFAVRDLENMLVPPEDAQRRQDARAQQQQQMQQQQQEMMEAQIRLALSNAFKNIAQGNKNSANADATQVKSVIDLLEKGVDNEVGASSQTGKPN